MPTKLFTIEESQAIEAAQARKILTETSQWCARQDVSKRSKFMMCLTELPRRLHGLHPDNFRIALDHPPPLTDSRWDAMLAAVCEHMALARDVPVPAWCELPERFLHKRAWIPGAKDGLALLRIRDTPPAFIRHGLFPDVSTLDFRCGEPHAWVRGVVTAHDARRTDQGSRQAR